MVRTVSASSFESAQAQSTCCSLTMSGLAVLEVCRADLPLREYLNRRRRLPWAEFGIDRYHRLTGLLEAPAICFGAEDVGRERRENPEETVRWPA